MIILNDEHYLRELLDKLYAQDIGGATVIDSMGMGHLMAEQISIFSRFADISLDADKYNSTVFTLIDNEEKLDKAIAILEDIVEDFEEPESGMWFVLPVLKAKGYK